MFRCAALLILGPVCLVLAQAPSPPQMTRKEYIEGMRKQAAAIQEANKQAITLFGKLQAEMEQLGMKGEAEDCKRILEKCLEPGKSLPRGGGGSNWPGEEVYFTKVCDRFAEVGAAVSAAFLAAAEAAFEPAELKEQYEIIGLWLGTFPEIAARMKHFNQRRKECKLGPVTNSWSSSYGGFRHGRYCDLNKDDASTAGLGAHNESPKLPGYSTEGAAAAKGIGGGGWFDGWMGSMYHREPVFLPGCSRIAFGGYKHSWWCTQMASGNKQLDSLITWPGDGATNISGIFGGEHPNPLPAGVTQTGTMIVIQYYGGKPKGFHYRLLDPSGQPITDMIEFSTNPTVFAPKKVLAHGTYVVELLGEGYKKTVTFTVGAGPFNTRVPVPVPTPRQPDPPPPPQPEPEPPAPGPITGTEPKPEPEKPPEKKDPEPEPETGTPLEQAFKRLVKATPEKRPERMAELYRAWAYAKIDDRVALVKAFGKDALRGKGLPEVELDEAAELAKRK